MNINDMKPQYIQELFLIKDLKELKEWLNSSMAQSLSDWLWAIIIKKLRS